MSVTLLPLKSLTGDVKHMIFTEKKTPFEKLKNSIIRDGLLNPLIVVQYKNKFKVIDGKKRLSIIRKLSKSRHFMRSLNKVPCIIEEAVSQFAYDSRHPILMSEPELAHVISNDLRRGVSKPYIAERFDCALSTITDVETLANLHDKVMKCFNDCSITLNQAAAFATVPNKKAQWDLLLQLGPFVSNKEIISAIKNGETVLELPDDNILIIPSRKPAQQTLNLVQKTVPQETVGALTHRLAA